MSARNTHHDTPAQAGGRWLLLLLAVFIGLLAVFWVGFVASDDVAYARGGYGWIESFPFVGGHGTIRYPITIPVALSFLTFGNNEYALALPSLLYFLGAVWVAWALMVSRDMLRSAVFATTLIITTPLFITEGSVANVDVVELFYQLASIALFLRALNQDRPAFWLFAAGVMAGLGFLTRETAIFIAGFYAILFFAGYRLKRTQYLWIVAGFIGMWLVEVLYLWIMTGDPLYRITIALNHDSTIDRSIDLAGNFIVHPAIDPLLVLLINQEFMLLFWLAIPAGLWLCFGGAQSEKAQQLYRIMGLHALVIFFLTGAAVTLLPLNPRYFMVPAFVGAIMLGAALARLYDKKPRLILLAMVGLVLLNLLGSYVENRHYQYAVRELAKLVVLHPDAHISTDPMTRFRADIPLKWNDALDRVDDKPPVTGSGALYLWNPVYGGTPNIRMPEAVAPAYARPTGTVIWRGKPPQDPVLGVIEAAGMRGLVPGAIWSKLANRHPEVLLIRLDKDAPAPPRQ